MLLHFFYRFWRSKSKINRLVSLSLDLCGKREKKTETNTGTIIEDVSIDRAETHLLIQRIPAPQIKYERHNHLLYSTI